MVTYSMMLVLVFCLIFILLFQARKSDNSGQFFDVSNTQAMRGFWCIIIMLVHVPSMYTNPLQDMLGSFAYIGVTFFFMVSAYGLKQQLGDMHVFWRKRLPKLLVPCLITNIIFMVLSFFEDKHRSWKTLVSVNHWVFWLIVCYVIYWIAYKCVKNNSRDIVVVGGTILLSIIMYWKKSSITIVTWAPEIVGFAWGIVLAKYRDKLLSVVRRKWLLKEIISILIASALGLLYLKYKYVVVWGDYLLKIVLGIAILMVILIANAHITIGNKASHFLGKISYEVYLIHGGVYLLISHYYPQMNSGVYILVSIVVTILLSSTAHYLSVRICKYIRQIKL